MRFVFVLFLAFLAGLSACSPANKTYSYTPIETPGGRLCALQCGDARNYCAENCGMDQRRCTTGVQAQALEDYDKYTRDQFVAHQLVELHVHDFERTEPCDDAKKSCGADCENNYQTCYQSCGGKVETSTSCRFFCF